MLGYLDLSSLYITNNKEVIMKNRTVMAFLLVVSIWGCESATDTGKSDWPIVSQVRSNGMLFTLSISAMQFNLLDTLRGTFRVTNDSTVEQQFNFANVQQLGFQLADSNGAVAMFYPTIVQPALSSLNLHPGETKEYPVVSLFKDYNGRYIFKGTYGLSAFLLEGNSPHVSITIQVN
jgi:hypothetical protein